MSAEIAERVLALWRLMLLTSCPGQGWRRWRDDCDGETDVLQQVQSYRWRCDWSERRKRPVDERK